MVAKTIASIEDKQAEKLSRIANITDSLLDKLERAVDELDIVLNTHTVKTKVTEYNNDDNGKIFKPTKEVVTEDTHVIESHSIIDRSGLKSIASALKDIKEIQMIKSELDKREQEARIMKLRKEAQEEDNTSKVIKVEIKGEAGEYCE